MKQMDLQALSKYGCTSFMANPIFTSKVKARFFKTMVNLK